MNDEKGKLLLTARLIWASLLFGQVTFFAVVAFLLSSGRFGGSVEDPPELFAGLAWGATVVLSLTGFGFRSFMFRPTLEARAIPPQRWLAGNIVTQAFLEGATLLGIMFVLITGDMTPYVYPAAIAFALQVVLFPREILGH